MRKRVLAAVVGTAAALVTGGAAHSAPAATAQGFWNCAPSASAVGFSDSLDKLVYNGTELGGLSSLAYDARQRA